MIKLGIKIFPYFYDNVLKLSHSLCFTRVIQRNILFHLTYHTDSLNNNLTNDMCHYEVIGIIFTTIIIAGQDQLRMNLRKCNLFLYIYLFSFWREKDVEKEGISRKDGSLVAFLE